MEVNYFKYKYLYIPPKYIGKLLLNYITKNTEDIDNIILIKKLKLIFPYLHQNDMEMFIKYAYNMRIIDYNKIQIILPLKYFDGYIDILNDDKISVDLNRICYTQHFINHFKNDINDKSDAIVLNTDNISYLKEERIYYFNAENIKNYKKFNNNLLQLSKPLKYILHQDIHNSIINPILIILIKNKILNNTNIIQLEKIKQIYKTINEKENAIEFLYLIETYFEYDYNKLDIPKRQKIEPFLLIKFNVRFINNEYLINIVY